MSITTGHERAAGESKYPLKKMLNFAVEGITSFSVRPLRIISTFGIIIACLSVFGLLYSLISKLTGSAVSGWTAIVASSAARRYPAFVYRGVRGIYRKNLQRGQGASPLS